MTADKIALRELLERGSDMTFLRKVIGFAAQRLMELEVDGLCGATHGERSDSRTNQRQRHLRPELAHLGGHGRTAYPKNPSRQILRGTNSGRRSARLFSPKQPLETDMSVASHCHGNQGWLQVWRRVRLTA